MISTEPMFKLGTNVYVKSENISWQKSFLPKNYSLLYLFMSSIELLPSKEIWSAKLEQVGKFNNMPYNRWFGKGMRQPLITFPVNKLYLRYSFNPNSGSSS